MTILAVWITGAALTYWLAEREIDGQGRPGVRREIAIIVAVAWPCALAIHLLSVLGVLGNEDDGA